VTALAGGAVSAHFEDITMPAPSSPKTLYRIDECPDLMADGVVGDENGNLVFISLWARDTAVQEFLARLTLGRDEQGLDQFHVITEQGASAVSALSSVGSSVGKYPFLTKLRASRGNMRAMGISWH
jgi:hypothetical protein